MNSSSRLVRSIPVACLGLVVCVPAFAQWQPPIGIPMPPIGITEVAGATTNTITGTQAMPALTAGKVIEITGTYSRNNTGGSKIVCNGTAGNPAFIRGAAGAIVTNNWEITGSYCIVENLKFSGPRYWTVLAPASFIAVRDSEFVGTLAQDTGGLHVQTWSAADASNIVLLRNNIHHSGDVNALGDQDNHGTNLYRDQAIWGTSATLSNIWILDSTYSYNSGDGIQINGGANGEMSRIHHVYVGRNVSHHNKQAGFWVKQATDVIFSQNEAYSHVASGSSEGQCTGFQYGPEYVWFLFNRLHDCEYGIDIVGDEDSDTPLITPVGLNTYMIGNVIYGIHGAGSASDPYKPSAIHVRGSTNRYIVNNTIYDSDAGIQSPVDYGALHMVNNVISQPTKAGASHVFIEDPAVAAASVLHHDIFAGGGKIRWGSGTNRTLAQLIAAFPTKGANSSEATPTFVNAGAFNFALASGSAGIDAGSAEAVYGTFLSRYGIDIAKDFAGSVRPLNSVWDIGAYEFVPGGLPQLSINNVSVTEAISSAVFSVTLSPAAASTVTVSYATANGTATAGSDYTATSGVLTFTAGQTTRTVSVPVLRDAVLEGPETFKLSLSGATGAAIAQSQGTATIADAPLAPGDLGGDNKSDIMWRKTGLGVDKGAMFLWTMNGTGITGARYLDPISEDWQVQFTGDFNGDGKADVLWRNLNPAAPDVGYLYIWIMDGPNVVAGTGYTNSQADMGWRVDGVGDLNGDGKSDIVWRKTGAGVDKGAVFLWTMNGTTITSARYLDPISEDWQVVDLGDFNGDGKADVLWRNMNASTPDAGQLYIWIMDGPNVVGGTGYTNSQADLGWRVDGVGDLNGDGKSDIVWRKTAAGVDKGAMFLWTMEGTSIIGARYLDPIGEDWQVQGLGDFNGDGKVDVLWRNQGPGVDVGKLYIWIMDGPNVVAGTGYTASQADLGWRVDSPKK
jgi:hypothetical protein